MKKIMFSDKFLLTQAVLDGRKLLIVNNVESERDDLMQDFVSIITSFCARLYGIRRSRRKTEELITELEKREEKGE